MSSRLPCDPHPRTTKKASASAAAVQLLLRHRGGRGDAAAKDESIEFFSALSGQTDDTGAADRRGKAKLRAEVGKHDYDWLLTPPATPLSCSPALSRLTRATSASHAKSNSPLFRARREKGSSSSLNTTELASSGRPPHVRRTLSSASSSSVKAASSASGRSTPATSPRTPAAATARPEDKTYGRPQVSSGSGASNQPKGPSSSRPRAPTTGASGPKSTRVRSEQPALSRRGANAVARSRFAGQLSCDAMSTAQAAESAVPPSMMLKTRPVPAAGKQRSQGNGMSVSPATAASRSAARGDLLAASKRLSSSGADGRKTHGDEKATAPRRAVGFGSSVASTRRCLTKADSRKLTANEGAQQRSVRSAAPGGRLGPAAAVSDARGRRRSSAAGEDKVAVKAPDAFPSTRYDAMLLREDPKNLTWLNGCGEEEDDDDGEDGCCGGAGLVDGSLEPFHV
ncbi:hypothetical protein ZWY2020_009526 [Hordeum vulgare]|nr:hypothetical protein ZWY2020_009526 [Hordeum vulgare]